MRFSSVQHLAPFNNSEQHALSLLKTMRTQKIWPNTTSYSATISACAQGKCWELALQLLEDCKTWATLNNTTYHTAMTVCVHSGEWSGVTLPLFPVQPFLVGITFDDIKSCHESISKDLLSKTTPTGLTR